MTVDTWRRSNGKASRQQTVSSIRIPSLTDILPRLGVTPTTAHGATLNTDVWTLNHKACTSNCAEHDCDARLDLSRRTAPNKNKEVSYATVHAHAVFVCCTRLLTIMPFTRNTRRWLWK